jgi:site-specific recombinase XerD
MERMSEWNYASFLAAAMRDYLDYLDALGFNTTMPVCYLRRIDQFLVEREISHIEQINNQLMIQFVDEYKGQVRAKTLQLYRNTFHGLCRYLIRQGWLTENPIASFPVPKLQPYRPHVFSPRELRLFFDFLKEQMKQAAEPVSRFRALSRHTFYHLLYACGLRVSEATALSRNSYSPEHATLYIERSKFLKDRLIPISRTVCSNLDYLLESREKMFGIPPEGFLFLLLPDRRPYTRDWASLYFRSVLKHLGIYHGKEYHRGVCCGTPHLHELRRAFAIHRLLRWYREKADVNAKLPLLATYMGHSHFGHTKTYLTLTEQLLSEAANRFAGSFDLLDWVTDDTKIR